MQATKNLLYLQPLEDTMPNTSRWLKVWESKGFVDRTTHRLREGTQTTVNQLWTRVREVVANPNAEREVWLVLGGTLSLSSLRAKAAKSVPEAIQAFAILYSTWGAVSQLGARLRIFCSA
jgi:hypothetical protein